MIDQEEFVAILVEPYAELLYAMVISMCNDVYLAADICQNTFEKAWKSIDRLHNRSKAKAWLFSIAKNELKSFYRKYGTYHAFGKEILFWDVRSYDNKHDESEPIESIIADEMETELHNGIQQLKENYRKVLESFYLMEMSTSEIAKLMDMREDRVRQIKCRGLKILRNVLNEELLFR